MSADATSTFQRPASQWSNVSVALNPAKNRSRLDQAVIRATVQRREIEFLDSTGIKVAMPLGEVLHRVPKFWLGVARCAERLGLLSYLPLWTRARYWFASRVLGR